MLNTCQVVTINGVRHYARTPRGAERAIARLARAGAVIRWSERVVRSNARGSVTRERVVREWDAYESTGLFWRLYFGDNL
jgi:hypothetical protein